jgi:uncharacterized protein (DUF4415 family)
LPSKITDRDNPEWSKEDFAKAKKFRCGTSLAAATAELLKTRARPRLERPKEAIKLRLDADVIEAYRKTGTGWQTRINADLRRASGLNRKPECKRA